MAVKDLPYGELTTPMPKRRGETGQYVETVALDDVLDAFGQVDGPPVVTSADVADLTGLSRDSARRKLEELEQRGDVRSRKTAGRVLYWRHRDEVSEDSTKTPASEYSDGEPAQNSEVEGTAEPPDKPSAREDPTRNIDDTNAFVEVEFPEGRDTDECEAAVLATRDYLRKHGPATMREIVTVVMPDHPVGYDVPELELGDRFRGAWWRRVVKPGLQALPDIKAPNRGASHWRYIGD